MSRLLLVEDDADLGPTLKRSLELDGHTVDLIVRGDEVIPAVSAVRYDVVLLDLGLPHLSGLEALEQLRENSNPVPVIIITALDRPHHRVAGLDGGADDYLVKPVDLEELSARIRSQIRRQDRLNNNYISIGDVMLNLTEHSVSLRGELLVLTPKEYKILALLMRRNRRFVSKSNLEDEIYDNKQWVESNTVEVAISSLRRKLGRDFIRTARGLGYMVGGKEN